MEKQKRFYMEKRFTYWDKHYSNWRRLSWQVCCLCRQIRLSKSVVTRHYECARARDYRKVNGCRPSIYIVSVKLSRATCVSLPSAFKRRWLYHRTHESLSVYVYVKSQLRANRSKNFHHRLILFAANKLRFAASKFYLVASFCSCRWFAGTIHLQVGQWNVLTTRGEEPTECAIMISHVIMSQLSEKPNSTTVRSQSHDCWCRRRSKVARSLNIAIRWNANLADTWL